MEANGMASFRTLVFSTESARSDSETSFPIVNKPAQTESRRKIQEPNKKNLDPNPGALSNSLRKVMLSARTPVAKVNICLSKIAG